MTERNSEYKLNPIFTRTREGIELARQKGKRIGRPPGISLSTKKLKTIIDLRNNGNTINEISLKTGVPISSVYRYIKLNKTNI
jgi:DNA invertase Pin-like site-specific DNA recombinase